MSLRQQDTKQAETKRTQENEEKRNFLFLANESK